MNPDAPAPLVYALTTSYNQSRWLPDTLDSVERQEYPHVEHIVVDDGCTDASRELLAVRADGWAAT